MSYTADIHKTPRRFLPEDFTVSTWENLEPYFSSLEERELPGRKELEQWLRDMSELEAVVSEDACWRQIRMTCDTENKALEEAFVYFCMEIQPKLQTCSDRLNRKLIDCPFTEELDPKAFFTYLRNVRKSIDLFRESNVSLQAELNVLQQQYGAIAGKMTVTIDEQEFTLQQAAKFLEKADREVRENAYRKINDRRLEDRDALDDLYTQLIEKRQRVALNAGYANYRDYRFEELGRFDYTKEDCFQFHDAVKQHVLPLVRQIYEKQKEKLGLDTLRPWDIDAVPEGEEPLHPFRDGRELLDKSIRCLDDLNPFFGDCLRKMDALGHMDLDSRKGKAPGGYNCPLAESGAPFIFMNAAGQMSDVTTMVHESGHAIHSFLSHPLALSAFKEYPMEIAEVASMSMELFTMEHWEVYFGDKEDLKKARIHQLERVITIFPWIATIDKFQHWIYENPGHTLEARRNTWLEILEEFTVGTLDVKGLENYRTYSWQRQLHLFEVPFYYIEYGIAQLGAIGMWKQFRENPSKALGNYIQALSLGGTRTLPELYASAGLQFDFSPKHIQTLIEFIQKELVKLYL
jgi:oligoendopeptidase F